MSFLGFVSQLLRSRYFKVFEKASYNPQAAQWEKLQEILTNHADTEFGKKYNFASIKSFSDFQKKVPVSTFADLKPYLDRMVAGEKNVLTSEEAIYYCITSGSTGKPKMTPITQTFKKDYQSVVQTFLYFIYRDHPRAFGENFLLRFLKK
jgi:acyl-coenzyme A synthetase/AMP-(fatty) acid ligase